MSTPTAALVIGRFQMPHNVHMHLIEKASSLADHVFVFIGSIQEVGSLRNPFSGSFREKMLRSACSHLKNIHFYQLPDLTNEHDHSFAWGEYLLQHIDVAAAKIANSPKLKYMVYGDDEGRSDWFFPETVKDIEMVILPREDSSISATKLRRMLVENDYKDWSEATPKSIHHMYEEIRLKLMAIESYGDLHPILESKYIHLYSRQVPSGQYRHFAHNPWCNGIGVGILAYKKILGEVHFLGRYEICAAHGDLPKLGLIVGGYDNMDKFSLAECVLNELKEEGGISAPQNSLVFLGKVRPNKGSDTVEYLYACDVEGLDIGDLSGDDVSDSYTEWITAEQLLLSDDTQLLCAYLKGHKKQLF